MNRRDLLDIVSLVKARLRREPEAGCALFMADDSFSYPLYAIDDPTPPEKKDDPIVMRPMYAIDLPK